MNRAPRCLIYFRTVHEFHSQNPQELAAVLVSLGWEVRSTRNLGLTSLHWCDVVVAVNGPSAVRAAAVRRFRPVVYYALEVDLAGSGPGKRSTLPLPFLSFDGTMATSERRLALLSTMTKTGGGLVFRNCFFAQPIVAEKQRERAAVYAGGNLQSQGLQDLLTYCGSRSLPVDIVSYSEGQVIQHSAVRTRLKYLGNRRDLVNMLAAYSFGLLPSSAPDSASVLDFLYTPNKYYDYLAAGLVILTDIRDPDPGIRGAVRVDPERNSDQPMDPTIIARDDPMPVQFSEQELASIDEFLRHLVDGRRPRN